MVPTQYRMSSTTFSGQSKWYWYVLQIENKQTDYIPDYPLGNNTTVRNRSEILSSIKIKFIKHVKISRSKIGEEN